MSVLSIGGHAVGSTELKSGLEDHIYPWEVIGYISFRYPNCQGQGALKLVSGVRTTQTKTGFWGSYSPKGAFLGRFHETKVEEHPCKWGGWVRSD